MKWLWCCRLWTGSPVSITVSCWRRERRQTSAPIPTSRMSTSARRAVMLEIRDLHSFYGEAHVVQGASLTVRDREVVALLGRNGMGKTSLIRSVMGLAAPQVKSGTVAWKGEVLTGLKSHEIARRRISLVPQGRLLFPSLNVVEHLTMF